MKFFFTVFMVILSMKTIAQNSKSTYFKHLVFRETPYAEVKGRISITKERALKENHYKLSYDDKNRLRTVEYRFGNKLIQTKRSGMLDGNRNLMPRTKIDYKDKQEIRTFYDENGKQRKNFMGVYKEVYTYSNNKRVGLKHFNEKEEAINNTWNIFEYIWTLTDGETLLEKRKNTKGDFVSMRPYYKFMTTKYIYTSEGILVSMSNVDEKGKLVEEETGVAIDAPIYDKDFNLVSYNFYNANKEPVIGTFVGSAGGVIAYDNNGNVLEYRTIDLEGKPMVGKRPYVFRNFDFDTYGNVIKRAFYGLKNELVSVNNITVIKYQYSKEDPSKLFKTEFYHTLLKE